MGWDDEGKVIVHQVNNKFGVVGFAKLDLDIYSTKMFGITDHKLQVVVRCKTKLSGYIRSIVVKNNTSRNTVSKAIKRTYVKPNHKT
jgi:hypothetical protein